MLFWDEARRAAMPFRTPRPVIDLRVPSSPKDIGWWTAFPRAIQLMLSTSCCMGFKSLLQVAITSSIGGGGDGNPVSSQ